MTRPIAEQARGLDVGARIPAAVRSRSEMLRSDPALARLSAGEAMQPAKAGQRDFPPVPHDQIAIAATVMLPPGGLVPQFRYARRHF